MTKVMELIVSYNAKNHLQLLRSFQNYSLTESQFAQFIGKSRLYQCLLNLKHLDATHAEIDGRVEYINLLSGETSH